MRLNGEFQGREWEAEAQVIKGQLWVHMNGRTLTVEPEVKKSSRRGGGKVKSGDIVAPMPGKVTKLLKQKGDSITAGDAVLVMEAMKMEYTLKADVSGQIEQVQCAVGEQVALGKMLVKISTQPEAAGTKA